MWLFGFGTWKPQGHKGYLAEVGEGRVLLGAVVEVQVVQVLVTVNGFNKVGKEDRGGGRNEVSMQEGTIHTESELLRT